MGKFDGLSGVNVELTSRCNKNCWCCGRRKRERENPEIQDTYGDMPWEMVELIANQLPSRIVVQLHNNGEPLLYPRLGDALDLFNKRDCLVAFDTNGKLLVERADQIIDRVHTITISVVQHDEERQHQIAAIREFMRIKGNQFPKIMVARLNGEQNEQPYRDLGMVIAKRILHDPRGSFNYTDEVVIPEIGVCLEVLHHLSIDRDGNVSCCVRFDPEGHGIIGNINTQSLSDIWNSPERDSILRSHVWGLRSDIPLCNECEYWGCPNGWKRVH